MTLTREKEQGSAIIIAILVILVLTLVGVAAALFMNIEDKLSSNDMLSQEAFYAAQAGLHQGEQIVTNYLAAGSSDLSGIDRLGTVLLDQGTAGTPLYQVSPQGFVPQGSERVYYTLYLRNNTNDYASTDGTDYQIDHDGVVNLISLGAVIDTNGRVLYTRILSEQFNYGLKVPPPSQIGLNQGGTGSS
ncbi:MAG: PilX N-terminal domain-containing pilus assembly protein [Acidobacteriota bacterium]